MTISGPGTGLGAVAASTSAGGGKADTLAGRESHEPAASKGDSRITANALSFVDRIVKFLSGLSGARLVGDALAVGNLAGSTVPLEGGVDLLLNVKLLALPPDLLAATLRQRKDEQGAEDDADAELPPFEQPERCGEHQTSPNRQYLDASPAA